MTDQNQLLREALQDIEQAHDLSLDLDHYASRQVLVSLADKIKVALAQPAEGGEVDGNPLSKRCYTMSESHLSGYRLIVGFESLDDVQAAHSWVANIGRTTPPASQEQAQQPGACTACVMPEQCAVDIAERGPCSGGVQQPSAQAWANETGLRQIECPSCGDLAVAYDPQQPSGEIEALRKSLAALKAENEMLREALKDASVQPELVAVALAACDAVDDLIEKWYATRESGCLPNQVVRARGASKLLRAIALEKENSND